MGGFLGACVSIKKLTILLKTLLSVFISYFLSYFLPIILKNIQKPNCNFDLNDRCTYLYCKKYRNVEFMGGNVPTVFAKNIYIITRFFLIPLVSKRKKLYVIFIYIRMPFQIKLTRNNEFLYR